MKTAAAAIALLATSANAFNNFNFGGNKAAAAVKAPEPVSTVNLSD